MFKLIKERRHLTLFGILVLVFLEILYTSAERHTGHSADGTKHRLKRQAADLILMGYNAKNALRGTTRSVDWFNNIRKRQAGDIIFMGYKAHGALKGTTKPSDYFQQIGKKWAGFYGSNKYNDVKRSYLDAPSDNGGLYMDDDAYDVKEWR